MQNYREHNIDGKTKSNPIDMLRHACQIALENFWAVILTFAFLTIPPIWASTYLTDDDGVGISGFVGLAAIIPQVLLTERALSQKGLIEDRVSKWQSYSLPAVGLSLLAGLGILLGFFALIIPGLWLVSRWSVSLPALIAQDYSVTESLQASLNMTAGRFWFCLLSVSYAWVPALVGIAVYFLSDGVFSIFVADVIIESALSVSMLLSWFVSVALYAELVGKKADLTG